MGSALRTRIFGDPWRIDISISEPRNIDFQVGVDLMDPLQILLRSRKNHQNFEILDFDKKSRNHFKCNMGTFSL